MSSLISGERIGADDSGLVSEERIVADDAVGSLASAARITMSGALGRGPQGPQGEAGAPGESAYEAAVRAGYTGTVEQFGEDQARAADYAREAGEACEQAAAEAEAAARSAGLIEGWTRASAAATALSAGSAPDVAISQQEDGSVLLTFGIPRGQQGERGPQGDTPPLSDRTPAALGTADAGTGMNAAREDHVHPMPTAHDVGALAEGGTAADSSLLGGKAPEAYAEAGALAAQGDSIGDAWAEGVAYALGDYAISANRLYRCITAHTAGSAFDSACWEAVSVSGEIRRKTGNRFGTATSITTSGTTVPSDGVITVSYNSNSTAWAYLEVFINGITAFIAQIGSTDRLRIFDTLRVNRGDVITFSAVNSPTYEIKFRPVA